ncbi:SDR family oxidoreductase [Candidatus Peregrinibacteria bacterium]|nr:SDR family oxidoreductase [Candidatus Peregrinibacteria bacterium]
MQLPIENLLNLSGKTAIVTGSAMGIGFGIVSRLAQAGANVVIADVNADAASKAAQELEKQGFKTLAVAVDVSKEADVQKMVDEIVKKFGGIDILVNNAGIFPSMLVMQMSAKDFEKVISVNLEGVFLCTKKIAEQMIKQGRGGRIINITSIDALHPSTIGLAHYDASKHGVWGFTKNVALELAPHEIWVNAIAPGGIATPGVAAMQKAPAGIDMAKMLEAFLAKIPMHKMGEPDDIAKVALFLASDMSSYMTGSQIVVDGGALLS